jgi:thiol-disulfide isomerase/thioredoxin
VKWLLALLLTYAVAAEDLSLAELRASGKVQLLMSWTTACPCCREGEQRLLELQRLYPEVRMRAFASHPLETPALVQQFLRERDLPLPVVFDRGGVVARLLDVRKTATALLWNERGELVYSGGMNGVETALQQLRGGLPVQPRTAAHKGCTIPRL